MHIPCSLLKTFVMTVLFFHKANISFIIHHVLMVAIVYVYRVSLELSSFITNAYFCVNFFEIRCLHHKKIERQTVLAQTKLISRTSKRAMLNIILIYSGFRLWSYVSKVYGEVISCILYTYLVIYVLRNHKNKSGSNYAIERERFEVSLLWYTA